MKVLFAVNNESISESITKKYQQEYKEIISAKNVYYFKIYNHFLIIIMIK